MMMKTADLDAAMPEMGEAEEQQETAQMGDDTLPVELLGVPDDSEQIVNPEVGDRVSYTVEGRVLRVDGNLAIIKRESVNGKPIETKTPQDGLAALETMANGMDQEGI